MKSVVSIGTIILGREEKIVVSDILEKSGQRRVEREGEREREREREGGREMVEVCVCVCVGGGGARDLMY